MLVVGWSGHGYGHGVYVTVRCDDELETLREKLDRAPVAEDYKCLACIQEFCRAVSTPTDWRARALELEGAIMKTKRTFLDKNYLNNDDLHNLFRHIR